MLNSNEYILNNHLDRDLVEALRPITVNKTIYFTRLFQIRDGFIFSNSRFYVLSSVIAHCVSILACIHVIYRIQETFECEKKCINIFVRQMYYATKILELLISVYTIGVYSEKSVEIIKQIRDIDSKLGITKTGRLTSFKHQNYALLISIWSLNIFDIAMNNGYAKQEANLEDILLIMIRSLSDLDVMLAIFNVSFLYSRLNVLSSRIENSNNMADDDDLLRNVNVLTLFRRMLILFDLTKKVFIPTIAYYYTRIFIHVLLIIQGEITRVQVSTLSMEYQISKIIITFVWLLKIVIIMLVLCSRFEQVDTAILTTKLASLRKTTNCCLETQRTCKNILREIDINYKKMSAYGVWEVDAASFLGLFGLIATYIVVLMQFNFL